METINIQTEKFNVDVKFEIENDFSIVQDDKDDVKIFSVCQKESDVNLYPYFLIQEEVDEIKEKCYYYWFNDIRENGESV